MHAQDKKDLEGLYANDNSQKLNQALDSVLQPRFVLSDDDRKHAEQWKEDVTFPSWNSPQLNLFEMVWLRLLTKLKKYDVSNETIRKLKDIVFLKPDFAGALESNPLFNKIAMKSLFQAAKADGYTDPEKIVNQALKNPEVQARLKLWESPPIIALLLLDIILLKNHHSIIAGEDGTVFPIKTGYIDRISANEELNKVLHASHINISLNEIITEFLPHETVYEHLYSLSSEETQALEAVRSGDARSVEIVMDKESNIETLNVTELNKVDIASRLVDHIGKGGFQEIKIKSQNGNIVHYENKRRIKINKNGTGS